MILIDLHHGFTLKWMWHSVVSDRKVSPGTFAIPWWSLLFSIRSLGAIVSFDCVRSFYALLLDEMLASEMLLILHNWGNSVFWAFVSPAFSPGASVYCRCNRYMWWPDIYAFLYACVYSIEQAAAGVSCDSNRCTHPALLVFLECL